MSEASQTLSPKEEIKQTINRLKDENVYQGFPTGKRIPNFVAKNQSGENVEIYNKLNSEFMVINFFRGDWCGYCKSELEELQEIYSDLESLGANVISIAPQQPEKLAKLKDDLDLSFDLLSDPDLKIAKMFNLVWDIPDNLQELYLDHFDLNIPKLNSNDSWKLPVPATYIVSKDGTTVVKFEDLNYSKRMGTENIIDHIKVFKAKEN